MAKNLTSKMSLLLIALGMQWDTTMAVAQVGYSYPNLTEQADSVVVGKIVAAQSNSAGSNLMLLADRTLKGSFAPGQTVNIILDGAPPAHATGQPWGVYGVWFLQSAGNANWRIIRVPGSRNLEDSCYLLPEGSAPPSIATANAPPPAPLDLVLAELMNAAETFDPHGWEFLSTVDNFIRMPPSSSLTAVLRKMCQSSKTHVKAIGLAGLLFRGDSTVLSDLPLDSVTLSGLPVVVRASMISSIATVRDPTPSTVAVLGRIATTQTLAPGIRGCAAEALAKIHTVDTLPTLALLLDSPEAVLRNWAFAGFSRFVDNLPIEKPEMFTTMAWMHPQGPTPYRTADTDKHIADITVPAEKHAEYTSFWKAWWSRMKDQMK